MHGRIDIAVYAAGVSRDAVVWKLPVDEWDRVHDGICAARSTFFATSSRRCAQAVGGESS